ncbi:Lipoxygenase 1 [Hordeum vulgare]|nr:Lipoxygenase 1 [Hordeum vulgare]
MVVVPVAAAVGIAFAVLQWVLVSKVKVTTEPRVEGGEASTSGGKYGASEYLIEEEEGLNDHNVVLKCVEIQTAISEGETGVARGDTKKHEELELLIKDYPYAVDRMKIWTEIKKWVTDYCAIYYADEDRAVAADNELQAWWSKVRNVGHGDLSDAPWWQAMDCVDDLVETCATATSRLVLASPFFASLQWARMIHFALILLRQVTTEEEFEEYAEKAKTLPDTTTNESKLCLYRLYKQATVGPVNTGRYTIMPSDIYAYWGLAQPQVAVPEPPVEYQTPVYQWEPEELT